MKAFMKICLGMMLIVFALTGCIGENYDFTPPGVKLSSSSTIESEELAEATIDWRGEGNVQIEKEVTDIAEFAKDQPQMRFKSGEAVDLLFGHGDFDPQKLTVSLWQNDKAADVEVSDNSFVLPDAEGAYIIEVNLQTDMGTAQYVGNLVLAE